MRMQRLTWFRIGRRGLCLSSTVQKLLKNPRLRVSFRIIFVQNMAVMSLISDDQYFCCCNYIILLTFCNEAKCCAVQAIIRLLTLTKIHANSCTKYCREAKLHYKIQTFLVFVCVIVVIIQVRIL